MKSLRLHINLNKNTIRRVKELSTDCLFIFIINVKPYCMKKKKKKKGLILTERL